MSDPAKSPAHPTPVVRRALSDQRVEPAVANRGPVRPVLPPRSTAHATKNRGPVRRALPRS
jgi:hypothetical protein